MQKFQFQNTFRLLRSRLTLAMASPQQQSQQPLLAASVTSIGKLEFNECEAEIGSVSFDNFSFKIPVDGVEPEVTSSIPTSDDLIKQNDGNISEHSAYETFCATVTDDGFIIDSKVKSVDGTIRSDSDDEQDKPYSPLLERVPLMRIDAKGNWNYDQDWDTDSETEQRLRKKGATLCSSSSLSESEDESGCESDTTGYFVPHESDEMSLRKSNNCLTLVESETDDELSAPEGPRKRKPLPSHCSESDAEGGWATHDTSDVESLKSDVFERPLSLCSEMTMRSPMSAVSQERIDTMVLSPSEASVFSVQSEGSSHLSELGDDIEKLKLETKDPAGLEAGVEEYPQSDVSVRSPMKSLDSISIQSSYSCQ